MTESQPGFVSKALPPLTRVRWRLVAILMGFSGLNHFHRQSLPAVVDEVMRDCRLTETDMGWIYSAFLLGYVVFMIPGGWLADRRRGPVRAGRLGIRHGGAGRCDRVLWLPIPHRGGLRRLPAGAVPDGDTDDPALPGRGGIVAAWIPFEARAWANGLVLGATTIGVSAAPVLFGALSTGSGGASPAS